MTGIGNSPIVSALPNSVTNAAFMVFGMMMISDGCGLIPRRQCNLRTLCWRRDSVCGRPLPAHIASARIRSLRVAHTCPKRAASRGGPAVAGGATMPSHMPSMDALESHDDGQLNAELRLARLRSQVAVVRTTADHVERLPPA